MRFSHKPSAALQTQQRLFVLFCFCFTKIPGSLAILTCLGDKIEESERSEEPASAMTAQPVGPGLYPGPWCLGGFGKGSAQVLALET